MEMQQLRYFIAVANTLNFTRAAEECNITQPALTRAIKLLEFELGGDLIRREGRNTHLTDLGNRILPLLKQCHEAALTAQSVAKAVNTGRVATVTVGLAATLDLALIMDALRAVYAQFSCVQIKLKRGCAAQIAMMLKSGEVDLAVGGPLAGDWDRAEIWPLTSETFSLLANATHPLSDRDPHTLDVDSISAERFVLPSRANFTDKEFERLRAIGINTCAAHYVDTDDDMIALVKAGFGVAVAPSRRNIDTDVKRIEYAALDIRRPLSVYTVAGRPRSRTVTALLNALRRDVAVH